jgi:epidermal growth factor receptor substrate 15
MYTITNKDIMQQYTNDASPSETMPTNDKKLTNIRNPVLNLSKIKSEYNNTVMKLMKKMDNESPKELTICKEEMLRIKEEKQELTIKYTRIIHELRQEKMELERTVGEQRESIEGLQKQVNEMELEKEGYIQMLGDKLVQDESKLTETTEILDAEDIDKEKAELRQQLKQLKFMVVKLYKRFTVAEEEKSKEILKLASQLSQNDSKHREIEGISMEREELNNKLINLNEQFNTLKQKLNLTLTEKDKLIEELSGRLEGMKNIKPVEVNVQSKSIEESQQLVMLKNEVEKVTRKLNNTEIEKNRRIQELTDKLVEAELRCKKEVSIYNEHIKNIGSTDASKTILDLKEKLIDLELKLTQSENDSHMQIDDLTKKLFKSENEQKRLVKEGKKDIEKLNKDKSELNNKLSAMKDRADRLNRNLELLKDEKRREGEKWNEKLLDAESRSKSELKLKMDSAMKEKVESNKRIAEMKSTIKVQEKKLNIAESENKQLQKIIDEKTSEITSLNRNIKERYSKFISKESEKEPLRKQISELNSDIKKLQDHVSCLEGKLQDSLAENFQIKNNYEKDIQERIKKNCSEFIGSQDRIKELNEEVKKLRDRSGKDLEKLNFEMTEKLETIKNLNKELFKTENEKDKLSKQCESLTLKNKEIELKLGEQKESLKKLQEEISSIEEDRDNTKEMYNTALEELEQNKKLNEENIKELNIKLQASKTKEKEYEDAIYDLKKTNEDLNFDISKVKAELDEAKNTIEKVNNELEETKREREEIKGKFINGLEEFAKLKERAGKLKEDYEKFSKKKHELAVNTLKKMEVELNESNKKNQELEQRLVEVKIKLTEAVEKNELLNQKARLFEVRCNNLTEELEQAIYYKQNFGQTFNFSTTEVEAKFRLEENEMLKTKMAHVEAEKERYKNQIIEMTKELAGMKIQHKDHLLKFKEDYSKVYQEIGALKKALKSSQIELMEKEKEIQVLRENSKRSITSSPSTIGSPSTY